ncbi:hypothetical protein HUT19_03870 [Streptomyces sp. NA02950]|uniref:hypothetical protein n=1 Tax=Streptomyces sp. NA02950 TaxID=2742137 RepID=UPI00159253CF|nr:hypothetical protein [Streptomyces sp. NA02950]QKV90984.1 hypothetical protein HUT19_03870 [Streptomyces sp. NA02950]
MSTAGATGPGGVTAGINRIEGYLLLHRERDTARERARRFTGRLDWLTSAQRAEVERLYVQDQLTVTEQNLRQVARRCEELRAEYQEVYRALRRRLLLASLLGGLVLAVTAAALAGR